MKLNAIALALAALLGGCAHSPLPDAVRLAVDRDLAFAIEEAGPSAPRRPPPGMLRPIEVSADGVQDWLIDYEKAGFAGWCGTGGCRQKIFVSRPSGDYILAFDHQTNFPPLVAMTDGRAVLDIDLHGTHCDGSGVDECLRRFVWDEAAARFEEAPNAKGDPRLQGPVFQVVEPDPAPAPILARAAVLAAAQACREAGGDLGENGEPEILSAPDLNGDGRRDWIVDATYSICSRDGEMIAPAPVTQVFVTTPTGDVVLAYAAESLVYEIDVAERPAKVVRILTADDCGRYQGEPCPEQVLTWDGAAGLLR